MRRGREWSGLGVLLYYIFIYILYYSIYAYDMIYIYIYTHICIHICIHSFRSLYIYIYIEYTDLIISPFGESFKHHPERDSK